MKRRSFLAMLGFSPMIAPAAIALAKQPVISDPVRLEPLQKIVEIGPSMSGFTYPPIAYRTEGPWGAGVGRPLKSEEFDENFANLDTRLREIEKK